MSQNKSRRIAIFTGSRAEYGLFKPIISEISEHPLLHPLLLVAGSHLDESLGSTIREIEADGFEISSRLLTPSIEKNRSFTSRAIGLTINAVTDWLAKNEPDLMLIYADRFESFAALIASTQMNIPTAHIEGGDKTEGGALDDSVRHAMTKLAHIHFPTNLDSANRIRSMGEEEFRIHNVGFGVIDLIMGGDFATLEEIQIEFPIVQDKPIVLFTLHSITTSPELAVVQIQECLKAIKNLIEMEFQVIATYANADLGGEIINENLEQFAKQSLPNFHLRKSLGRYMYHGILALGLNKNWRVVCLGNSSSGIKETPALKCPTVNIGSRQKGRLRGGNVIDSVCESESIIDAVVNRALSEEFRETCDLVSNPYFCGGAGKQIAEIISRIPLDEKLLVKKMEI